MQATATFGTASGTGPPAYHPQRRSLLGSSGVHHVNGNGKGGAGAGTIPQKRKLGMGGRRRDDEGPTEKRRRGGSGEAEGGGGRGGEEEGDAIRCRCGSSADDGFSIACDVCGRWCHAACFGIVKDSVPEEWACWRCAPQNYQHHPQPNGNSSGNGRKRRGSMSVRRGGTLEPPEPVIAPPTDDLADERAQYVQIDDDIVPHASTQRKLRAYAAHWRGVSALSPPPPPSPDLHTPLVFGAPPPAYPTVLYPLPATATPAPVRPPTYSLHTTTPAPPRALLARFPALITPSAAYLSAPANGYAHLGAPRAFVHLVGPPLDLALDARGAGGKGRWTRSGCFPNAEVRAFVCGAAGESGRDAGFSRARGRETGGIDLDGEAGAEAEAEARTHFGIFATRALRAGEEVVVGWEWDDANAVHRVGEVAAGLPATPTPTQRQLVAQLANILHALGGEGAGCACAGNTSPRPNPIAGPSTAHPAVPAPVAVGEKRGEGDAAGVEEDWEGERECVLRAMERIVFPPAPAPVRAPSRSPYMMEVDIDADVDVEGDGLGDRVREGSLPAAASSAAATGLPISSSAPSLSALATASSSTTHLPATTSAPASLALASASTPSTFSALPVASSSSTPSATTTRPRRPRLAGPGVPPPSPEALAYQPAYARAGASSSSAFPSASAYGPHASTSASTAHKWGPLIGTTRGVRTAERVRGSGGWAGVVLVDAAGEPLPEYAYAGDPGYAWEGDPYAQEDEGGWAAGYLDLEGEGGKHGRAGKGRERERPYAVVERAGGWDVWHGAGNGNGKGKEKETSQGEYAGPSRGWDTEEDVDVDVVGDGDGDADMTDSAHAHPQPQEMTCPPKMRKRWNGGGGGAERLPGRRKDGEKDEAERKTDRDGQGKKTSRSGHEVGTGKGKGKARAGVGVDALPPPQLGLVKQPYLIETGLCPPVQMLSEGTSPSASFARLSLVSPHPGAGGARPAWFAAGVGVGGRDVNVDILPHEPADVVLPDADIHPPADTLPPPDDAEHDASADAPPAVQDAAVPADALPPAAADLSPRVHFLEPPQVDFQHEREQEHDEDVLLVDAGVEEPYRPSPESPSPAPETDSEYAATPEIMPRALEEEEGAASEQEESRASIPVLSAPNAEESLEDGDDAGMSPEATGPLTLAQDHPPPARLKTSLKEWNARKKREREEKALEDERAKEREEAEEREREREREKDTQGEDKENEGMPVKAEDALSRVLDVIRRDAVSNDKPAPREPPVRSFVQEDVQMSDAPPPPLDAPPPKPRMAFDERPAKARTVPLTMTAFVPTGGHERLSPLTVSSVADSRTPSPGLVNCASKVKREASPLVINARSLPPALNGVSKPLASSSLKASQTFPSPLATSKTTPPLANSQMLYSPKAPRFPSPSFSNNGVYKRDPPPHKPLPVPPQSPSTFSTNGIPMSAPSPKPPPFSSPKPPPLSSSSPSRPAFTLHTRVPSQEEGEIPSSPPAARPPFVFGARTSPFSTPSAPPTQPRSYQTQLHRAPPSAPKALREAQTSNGSGASTSAGGGAGRGRGGRFNGLVPQTMPAELLDPPARERANRRGHWRKHRGGRGGHG
ncbi:hypothetical protein C8R44DRAFT_895581 [Mycena epipterygia]|nr:hypothetical protein C8R44DRAFT_895581 [Mycena epipterygia]